MDGHSHHSDAGGAAYPRRLESIQGLAMGGLPFIVPFMAAGLCAHFLAGWGIRLAEIAAVALSTTSLAVVYAVLVETELTGTDIGKIIMAATFITNLGTVIALSVLLITPTPSLWSSWAPSSRAFCPSVSALCDRTRLTPRCS